MVKPVRPTRFPCKAFKELMRHIKEVDGEYQTVIMVQVENEVGLLQDSRDRSGYALKAFSDPVPIVLLDTLREEWDSLNAMIRANISRPSQQQNSRQGWAETFGNSDQTDELFMAYHYALYVEGVAAEGKKEYSLPMFTNAWLRNIPDETEDEPSDALFSGGVRPGDYPSGGPVETVLDIWKIFAPSLDFVAPDIYLTDYTKSCQQYVHRDQALFIPEQRRDEYGALRIWEAMGRFNAIATAPFGIDTHHPSLSPFTSHYGLLRSLSAIIIDSRMRCLNMFGFFFDRFEVGQKDPSPPKTWRCGSWSLVISRSFSPGHPSPGFGIIVQRDEDTFLAMGEGFQVVFTSNLPNATLSGILEVTEKEVVNEKTGELRTVRLLNGDEIRQGLTLPAKKPDMGDFVIESFIPAHTRIAECRVYWLNV